MTSFYHVFTDSYYGSADFLLAAGVSYAILNLACISLCICTICLYHLSC